MLYAVAGAVVLTYLPFLVVGFARMQVGYDLSAPRAMFERLPPYAQRATWAHQNSFEALIIFSVAALMAYMTGVESNLAGGVAIAFLVARLLYSIFYILDLPLARSFMFAIGTVSSATLFILSLMRID